MGAVWYALAHSDAAWWKVLLAAPLAIAGGIAGAVLACMLFAAVLWLFIGRDQRRRKRELRRFIQLAEQGDTVPAAALAETICRGYEFGYSDAIAAAKWRARLVALARARGELGRRSLRILGVYAPWSSEVEAALYSGADDLPSDAFSWWLQWFRHKLPDGPQRGERLAAALAHALPRMDERDRRDAWREILVLAEDTPAWRELATRYREDVSALEGIHGGSINQREREKLQFLLQ